MTRAGEESGIKVVHALRKLRQESHIYKREVERAEKTGDNISRSTAAP